MLNDYTYFHNDIFNERLKKRYGFYENCDKIFEYYEGKMIASNLVNDNSITLQKFNLTDWNINIKCDENIDIRIMNSSDKNSNQNQPLIITSVKIDFYNIGISMLNIDKFFRRIQDYEIFLKKCFNSYVNNNISLDKVEIILNDNFYCDDKNIYFNFLYYIPQWKFTLENVLYIEKCFIHGDYLSIIKYHINNILVDVKDWRYN